jgi:hypothetical protein
MKKKISTMKSCFVLAVLAFGLILGGCKDYLNKAPEASINEADVYKDFNSFQGFTEELYSCIVDVSKIIYTSDYNLADETSMNVTFFLGQAFDSGNYWAWQDVYGSYFKLNPSSQTNILNPNSSYYKSTWWCSWYGIRKANMGLANLDKLVNATQEEKDIIKGQLLFFRGYYYFVLMRDWGGLPYISEVLAPTDKMKFPRLNYQETALKAAADLEEAAQLLPLKWDDTQVGQRTLGNNHQRINKIMALSFLGKDLLYAASPLMNKESTGNANYNVDLCKKAAEVFVQVINTCEQTGVYALQPWATYSDMFYMVTPERKIPGGTEVIMNPPVYDSRMSQYTCMWGISNIGHQAQQTGVTANYVKYWGTKNGLPINDPASGYNPADPWNNRDPRFYKTIIVDGDKLCNSTSAGLDQYAQLYTNGRHRNPSNNVTGFLSNKYWGITCNKFDGGWGGGKFSLLPPLMRLSDVYLMYAEAVLQGYGTAQSSFPGSITAETALNKVRNRATLPNIDAKFTATKDAFMDEIIRERAVELSFENLRWNDLRRWLLNGDKRYLDKTELLFDRGPNGKPINIQERLIVTRVVQDRHNWLPLPVNSVTIYPEFGQNPGW